MQKVMSFLNYSGFRVIEVYAKFGGSLLHSVISTATIITFDVNHAVRYYITYDSII